MPDIGFDLDTFSTKLAAAGGTLKPTKFMFSMTPPPGLGTVMKDGIRDLSFWASTAAIPGFTFMTQPIRRYGIGVAEKRPWAIGFAPAQIGFMADAAGVGWTFFKQWGNLVLNYNLTKGAGENSPANGEGQQPLEISYPVDYIVDAVVSQFHDSGEEILRVVLRDAYPIQVSDMRTDWSQGNEISRFTAVIHFTTWDQHNLQAQQKIGLELTQA